MRPKYTPLDRLIEPDNLSRCPTQIAMLTAALLFYAKQAFTSAVRRQTHKEGAVSLAEEARSALSGILSDLRDDNRLEEQSERMAKELAEQLQAQDDLPPINDTEWIETKSQALARAFVGFWLDIVDPRFETVTAG